MFNLLLKLVFTIVGKIGDLILSPLVAGVSLLIPGFSNFVTYIFQFINYGLTYIIFGFKLFMIPQMCINAVITVAFATISIISIVRTYTLLVKIYNYFKP